MDLSKCRSTEWSAHDLPLREFQCDPGIKDNLYDMSGHTQAVMGMDRILLTSALAVGSAAAYGFPNCDVPPLSDNAVCDVALDAITRATALIDLFTVPELINNTVSTSPGVPRLGLPAYQWWSEGLVSYIHVS